MAHSLGYWKSVLILGNGFDLHLGLKSSFNDYFKKEILTNNEYDEKNKNLLLYLIYLRFFYDKKPSRAFFRTIYNHDPNWMDVEGFIKKIATEQQMLKGIYESMFFRNAPYNLASDITIDRFQFLIGKFLSKLDLPEDNFDYSLIKTF